ncbi:Bug family tripartite tricarboxylate transporter substrate binding protein [Roseomonas sp. CCTCC AB2023176]|uniref:Bug family tripartite tricarboxylate transporter substrate binding protein n=1 Tax=Roseomonas sp. CCTCC AB2023176 TaxID=3342640 RepID=UPI0035DF2D33
MRILLLVAMLLLPRLASAELPDRPVRVIVPFPPGGSSDFVTRVVVEGMAPFLRRGAVVENRAGGANGAVGMAEVARGPVDGSVLGHCFLGHCALGPALTPDLPYDLLRDFAPVALVGHAMNLMTVHRDVPAADVAAFVALARTQPGRLAFASSGIGSTTHLAAVLLAARTGIELLHVPYRGGGPALNDHLAGRVALFFNPTSVMLPHLGSGALRALAVTGAARDPSLPEVPTMAEAGFPDLVLEPWYSFVAPAGTPAPVVAALNDAVNRALATPSVRDRLVAAGVTVTPGTPEAYAAFHRAEILRWAAFVREQNIRAE